MINHLDPYGYMIPEIFPSGVNYLDVLEDGSTVAWFLSDEPTTITKDVADRVSRWNDYLGSGHDLIQGVGADQPLWSANGILFDGVSEFMKTAPFAWVQPEMIYIVFKQVNWGTDRTIFDGNTPASTLFYQRLITPPILNVYAGLFSDQNANLALNTWGIARILFNGASSTFQIDETTQLTGDYGTQDSEGFCLGARPDNTKYSKIEVKEIILRNVADTAPDEAAIYAYLSSKYGI